MNTGRTLFMRHLRIISRDFPIIQLSSLSFLCFILSPDDVASKESPFFNFVIPVYVVFDNDQYPDLPPRVFMKGVWHPNVMFKENNLNKSSLVSNNKLNNDKKLSLKDEVICDFGNVCLNLLHQTEWNSLRSIIPLINIYLPNFLLTFNPDSPLNTLAATMIMNNENLFNETAIEKLVKSNVNEWSLNIMKKQNTTLKNPKFILRCYKRHIYSVDQLQLSFGKTILNILEVTETNSKIVTVSLSNSPIPAKDNKNKENLHNQIENLSKIENELKLHPT